jgi:hypothetical protein
LDRHSDGIGGTAAGKARAPSPPYISFVTFRHFIEWLEGEGIPLRMDRSFWEKKYSGSTGVQLMSGLRFLGLLKGEQPQRGLEMLVGSTGDERREVLGRIIRRAYGAVDFDALRRATPSMLQEWLGVYGLEGDTRRKATSFLINACKEALIPLPNAIRKKARNKPADSAAQSRTRRSSRARRDSDEAVNETIEATAGPGTATDDRRQIVTVTLECGGTVTLAVDAGLLTLSRRDRGFVFELVDMLNDYADKEPG